MISEIGTTISTVGLLLQLYDRHGEEKVKSINEYKQSLRELVSTLYFSKSLHNLAHTFLDLDSVSIFDFDIRNNGVTGFQKAYDVAVGRIVRNKMQLEITPSLPGYLSNSKPSEA